MIRFHAAPTPRLAAALLLLTVAACGGAAPEAPAPENTVQDAAMTITADDVGAKIDLLAHDSMGGRDTPSRGLQQSAEYIAARFRSLGLEPVAADGNYLDPFEFTMTRLVPEETQLSALDSDDPATYAVDYFLIPAPQRVEAPAYYVGVAGEAAAPPEEARGRVLIYRHPGAEIDQEWQMRVGATLQSAAMSGAPGVIFILAPEFPIGQMEPLAAATAQQQAPLAVAGITHDAGRSLLAELGHDLDALEPGQPMALGAEPIAIEGVREQETHSPPNVAAMIRGSDPELADTYVVLTAHYDHVGIGQPNEEGDSIYNGADDNASGTAAVIEMAEAFADLDRAPRRSVIFLLVSGEEDGLLGSSAWVENPPVPIGNVVANINLDMVGRNAPDTIIGIGQEYSTIEDALNRVVAEHPDLGLNVILDPVPEENLFFRSDQLPFIQRDIPAIFFTSGLHDDYHEQSDEAALIDDDKTARVARLGFYLAHAIAMDPVAPEWTEEGEARIREMLGM